MTTKSDGGTVPPESPETSGDKKSTAMDWLKGRDSKPYRYPKPHRDVSDAEQEAGIRGYFGGENR